MKLVSWNCQVGFDIRYKNEIILDLVPDIAVIQDCLHPSRLNGVMDYHDAVWIGKKDKGICVFSFSEDYKLSMLINEVKYEWVVPIKVSGAADFVLLAVWARRMPGYSYGKLIYSALKEYEVFLRKSPVIIIGDFNVDKKVTSSFSGISGSKGFDALIEFLGSFGLTSCYHYFNNEPFGMESLANYFHYGKIDKPFHVHYCFVSKEILQEAQQFQIIEGEELNQIGFHLPLLFESEMKPTLSINQEI